jgi:hypothetical protein
VLQWHAAFRQVPELGRAQRLVRLAESLTEGEELGGESAVLGDGRVGVVAGDGRSQFAVDDVRPRPEAEVRPAVRHVDADAAAVGQDASRDLGGVVGVAHMVRLAPVVEPSVPELRDEEGLVRPAAPEQGASLIRLRTERGGHHDAGDRAAVDHQIGGPVGGVEQLLHAESAQERGEPAGVSGVVAVTAVLVLDLHGDDRPTMDGLVGREPGDELFEPGLDRLLVTRVRAAERDVAGGEPGRQAAVRPLRADVRAGSEEDVETEVGGGVHEPPDVAPAGELGCHVDLGLMEVPGDVGVDGVETEVDEAQHPVAPVLRDDTEVVQRSGPDGVRDAVAEQLPVAPVQRRGESGLWLVGDVREG